MKSFLRVLPCLAVFVFAAAAANGQATRTWVSGVGDDANPCSRTAPCKTFAGAITKTAAGGEIDALDPGGFGTVTITKSITIDGSNGSVGSILASGTNGVSISAGSSDVVTLRNLSINGAVGGTSGVLINSAGNVHIEHCAISNFGTGINMSSGTTANLSVDHTTAHDNSGAGISIAGSTGALVSLSDTALQNNGTGLAVSGTSKAIASNMVITGNSTGMSVDSTNGAATLNLVNSTSSNNTNAGIQVAGSGAAAVVRMTGVSLFSNGSGITYIGTSSSVYSYGDNVITGGGVPTRTLSKQ